MRVVNSSRGVLDEGQGQASKNHCESLPSGCLEEADLGRHIIAGCTDRYSRCVPSVAIPWSTLGKQLVAWDIKQHSVHVLSSDHLRKKELCILYRALSSLSLSPCRSANAMS